MEKKKFLLNIKRQFEGSNEHYIIESSDTDPFLMTQSEFKVPKDKFFFMGDNQR